jgi:hypothetical protein
VATCFNDVYVLDLDTLEWSSPKQEGALPTARAGHAGALLGTTWYIIGGGNNVKGCTDMLALDLGRIAQGVVAWTVVGQIPSKSPLSSEGITLVPAPGLRSLVAFGGYNGKYHNTVSVFKVGVTPPAQEEAAAGGKEGAPSRASSASPAVLVVGSSGAPAGSALARAASAPKPVVEVYELKSQLEAARREAEAALRAASAAKEGAAHELALMRKELSSTQAALAEAERGKEELAAQLQVRGCCCCCDACCRGGVVVGGRLLAVVWHGRTGLASGPAASLCAW